MLFRLPSVVRVINRQSVLGNPRESRKPRHIRYGRYSSIASSIIFPVLYPNSLQVYSFALYTANHVID